MRLSCGRLCQPTKILKEIQQFPSSTCPALVDTDVGQGYIKGISNPQGTDALVSELVAGELGVWMGLSIPSFAVVAECSIEIPMMGQSQVIQPPLFFSKSIDGVPHDGSDTFLQRLRSKKDLAKLVVFDTWVRNTDRYSEENGPSYENLLFERCRNRRSYELVPIDHTHCFSDGGFDCDLQAMTEDAAIYGLFPEFRPFIEASGVAAALSHLDGLDREFVQTCVNSIPVEWRMSKDQRNQLVDFICGRAAFLVSSLAGKLVRDPHLPGLF